MPSTFSPRAFADALQTISGRAGAARWDAVEGYYRALGIRTERREDALVAILPGRDPGVIALGAPIEDPPRSLVAVRAGAKVGRDADLLTAVLMQGARALAADPARRTIEVVHGRGAALPWDDEVAADLGAARDAIGRARVAVEKAARDAGLPATIGVEPEHHGFLRVEWDAPGDRALLEYLYGAPVVYLGRGRTPPRVRGTLLHNDPRGDAAVIMGAKNPALDRRDAHAALGDKWREYELLRKYAPALAPETHRLDRLIDALHLPADRSDPERWLAALKTALDGRFGRWILKPRNGFGSDGKLPTNQTDLAALWRDFQASFVPARAKLKASIPDPDDLNAALYEHVPFAEGQTLEALLADPASVIVQPFVRSSAEIRVHVVEGRVLEGATVARWARFGERLDPGVVRALNRAIGEMCTRIGAPLSFSMDVLVTEDGFRIVDLNPGLESGMYYPENDVFVPNLLAERFSGKETPFLRDFRAFARAPLGEKLAKVRALDERIGGFVRAHEAYGFYDRVISAYAEDVARDPTPARLREAWRQLVSLDAIGAWELYDLLLHPAVRPLAWALSAREREAMLADLNARDATSTSALVNEGPLPFRRAEEEP